jgi:hypothetical protein
MAPPQPIILGLENSRFDLGSAFCENRGFKPKSNLVWAMNSAKA